jgi:hypothetical protein
MAAVDNKYSERTFAVSEVSDVEHGQGVGMGIYMVESFWGWWVAID